ncbi:MAG TPA: hypothetical protein VEY94_12540 [Patescibacteria group bacterium]|nr:hypothetical protein [Patescibacteria group bacterium]
MGKADRSPVEHLTSKLGQSAALFAVLTAIAVGTSGCIALPFLSAIPSAVSFVYNVATGKSDSNSDADAKNEEYAPPSSDDSSKPPPKLTADNICHLMAIARPDLIVVELRKNAAGAPEYRELRLQPNTTEDARWAPVVDSDTGPEGWRAAVNFLKMDFKPALTDVIPDSGTCYLAYAPVVINPNNPVLPPEVKAAPGEAAGDFDWEGREYQYRVERTLPCLSPQS